VSLGLEIAVVGVLVAFATGGLVTWRVMMCSTVADLRATSEQLRQDLESTAAALGIFVGHIQGGQFWTPRMQKVYAAWKKEMNHDEDAASDET